MKRLFPVLLALLLALSACGGKGQAPVTSAPVPEAPASAPETSAPATPAPEPPDEQHYPQADDALVREMIFAYGAYEDTLNGPAVLTVRKKSLFHRMESWGAGDLTPGDYLYWADTLPMTEEEQKAADQGQHHAQDHKGESPFGYRFLPAAWVEETVLSRFDTTVEVLRGDPEYYDGSIPGYFLSAGGGIGEISTLSYSFSQEEDILTIPVTLTFVNSTRPYSTHTLTVRLEPDGGWKYLGCQVEALV